MTQTSEQVLRQQEADAARERQQKPKAQPKPAPQSTAAKQSPQSTAIATRPKTTLPAAPDTRTSVEKFLDAEAPSRVVGRRIDFSKEGEYVVADTGDKIGPETDFHALCSETLVGVIKFNGEGNPPTQIAGLLYEGFEVPAQNELPDRDPSQWPLGLSGAPEDPWKRETYLVLQNVDTKEFFTFVTRSKTGRSAAANLLRHYERLRKSHPGESPIVRLKVGGFDHKDPRVGWVKTPVFVVVGHALVDTSTRPDTSLGADMSDSIPF
jgi:hypothetical protein